MPTLTPTLRSLIYVANELSRAIDNIATCPWPNSFVPATLATLSSEWSNYFTMITYLTADNPNLQLSDYLIVPTFLPPTEPTPELQQQEPTP